MTPFSFLPAHRAHPGTPRCWAGRAYRAAAAAPWAIWLLRAGGREVLALLLGLLRPPPAPGLWLEAPAGLLPSRLLAPAAAAAASSRLLRCSCCWRRRSASRRMSNGSDSPSSSSCGGSGLATTQPKLSCTRRLRQPQPQDFPERSCRRGHCGPAAGSPRERVQRSRR